jgi:hypothetical protein
MIYHEAHVRFEAEEVFEKGRRRVVYRTRISWRLSELLKKNSGATIFGSSAENFCAGMNLYS